MKEKDKEKAPTNNNVVATNKTKLRKVVI